MVCYLIHPYLSLFPRPQTPRIGIWEWSLQLLYTWHFRYQLVDPFRYSVHLNGHCYYGNQEEQDHKSPWQPSALFLRSKEPLEAFQLSLVKGRIANPGDEQKCKLSGFQGKIHNNSRQAIAGVHDHGYIYKYYGRGFGCGLLVEAL